MARGCDICGSANARRLYRQRFAAFDDRSGFDGYDVAVCEQCGFAFAEGIPGQEAFDRYYRDMSKYESHESDGNVAPSARQNYRSIVAEIANQLPDRDMAILDVGSASGHLLAAFREAGYRNVTGFDPSPRCTEIARKLYGIDVVNTPISAMRLQGAAFGLVLLSSVLEHLRDLIPTIRELAGLLRPGGALWFEVPDAGRFPQFVEAPFQQFSLEHINFFTERSLANLLGRIGFEPSCMWTANRQLGAMVDPGLDAIFARASEEPLQIVPDDAGAQAIAAYVAASSVFESRLVSQLTALVREQTPVVIWGTGSLTLHLLANERLAGLRIAAFVDSNENYQGKSIGGIPVIGPAALEERGGETILIVSRQYEHQIATAIRSRYRLENAVVGLFASELSAR